MSNKKFNIFKSSKVRIYYIHTYYRGLKRCHGCVGWFLFAPAVLKFIINIHVATTIKRCRKAHYYYLQKEKHQRRFYLTPSIKDNFQTFVCAPRGKEGFLAVNKSRKIKTKRIQKRIGETRQKGLGLTSIYGRFSDFPLNGDVEKII